MKTGDNVNDPLIVFAIYAFPSDFPDAIVCRRWFLFPDNETPQADALPFCVGRSLTEVRKHIPPGLFQFARCEHDDPKIVETWF